MESNPLLAMLNAAVHSQPSSPAVSTPPPPHASSPSSAASHSLLSLLQQHKPSTPTQPSSLGSFDPTSVPQQQPFINGNTSLFDTLISSRSPPPPNAVDHPLNSSSSPHNRTPARQAAGADLMALLTARSTVGHDQSVATPPSPQTVSSDGALNRDLTSTTQRTDAASATPSSSKNLATFPSPPRTPQAGPKPAEDAIALPRTMFDAFDPFAFLDRRAAAPVVPAKEETAPTASTTAPAAVAAQTLPGAAAPTQHTWAISAFELPQASTSTTTSAVSQAPPTSSIPATAVAVQSAPAPIAKAPSPPAKPKPSTPASVSAAGINARNHATPPLAASHSRTRTNSAQREQLNHKSRPSTPAAAGDGGYQRTSTGVGSRSSSPGARGPMHLLPARPPHAASTISHSVSAGLPPLAAAVTTAPSSPAPASAGKGQGKQAWPPGSDRPISIQRDLHALGWAQKVREGEEISTEKDDTEGLEAGKIDLDTAVPLGSAYDRGKEARLHLAKLEVTPIALLNFVSTIPFAYVGRTHQEDQAAEGLLQERHLKRIANIGSEILLYPQKGGKIRIIHIKTGARDLLAPTIPWDPPSTGVICEGLWTTPVKEAAGRTTTKYYVCAAFATRTHRRLVGWYVPLSWGLDSSVSTSSNSWSPAVAVSESAFDDVVFTVDEVERIEFAHSEAVAIFPNAAGGEVLHRLGVGKNLQRVAQDEEVKEAQRKLRTRLGFEKSVKEKPWELGLEGESQPYNRLSSYATLPLFADGSQTPRDAILAGYDGNTSLELYLPEWKDGLEQMPPTYSKLQQLQFVTHNATEQQQGYNLLHFDERTQILLVANSQRASLMVFGISLDLGRPTLRMTPLKEYPLPEPCLSFSVEGYTTHGAKGYRVFVLHPGGVFLVWIPVPSFDKTFALPSSPAPVNVPTPEATAAPAAASTLPPAAAPVAAAQSPKSSRAAQQSSIKTETGAAKALPETPPQTRAMCSSAAPSAPFTNGHGSSKAAVSAAMAPTLDADQLAAEVSRRTTEAVQQQLGALSASINQAVASAVPGEIMRLLDNPSSLRRLEGVVSESMVGPAQRGAFDAATTVVAPLITDLMQRIGSDVAQLVTNELLQVRKDVVAEQSTALKQTQIKIEDMNRDMRSMRNEIAKMHRSNTEISEKLEASQQQTATILRDVVKSLGALQTTHVPQPPPEHQPLPPPQQPQRQPSYHQPSPPPAPFAPQPLAQQPHVPVQALVLPPLNMEDALLSVLSDPLIEQDPRPLRELLQDVSRRSPEGFQLNAALATLQPVSQPVLLALLHRLVTVVYAISQRVLASGGQVNGGGVGNFEVDLQVAIPMLEAAAIMLQPHDPKISSHFQAIQQRLATQIIDANFALAVPGGPAPWWDRRTLVHRIEPIFRA